MSIFITCISISPSRLQRTSEVEWGCIRYISFFGWGLNALTVPYKYTYNPNTVRCEAVRAHTCIHIHAKPFGIEKLVQYTKCQIMIWYALHDDLLLIVQFVYRSWRWRGGGGHSEQLPERARSAKWRSPAAVAVPPPRAVAAALPFTKTDSMRLLSIDYHCGAFGYI